MDLKSIIKTRWFKYLIIALFSTIYFSYKNIVKQREVGIDYVISLYFVLFLLLLVFDEIFEFFYKYFKKIAEKVKENK